MFEALEWTERDLGGRDGSRQTYFFRWPLGERNRLFARNRHRLSPAVIVGVGGGEFGIRGWVDGTDLNTGKQVWRTEENQGPTGGAMATPIQSDFSTSFRTLYQGKTLGSSFLMRVTFPVTGDVTAVGGMEATLSNTAGEAQTQRIAFP